MAEYAVQTLGFKPAAATPATVYTCPVGREATIHITWATASGIADDSIEVRVCPGGAVDDDTQFRVGPGYTVREKDTSEKRSISLVAGDTIRVESVNGNVTFQRSGIERDVAGAVTPTLRIREADGAPDVQPVNDIIVSNGTLTDNGSGSVTLVTGGGGGGGTTVTVNGAALAATSADLDDATPAAPAGGVNVKWQKDALTPTNISAHLAANDVSNTVLRDSAGFSVIGKATTGSGDPADIVAADETVLGRTGAGNLAFAQVATGQIADNAVTNAKLRDSAASSVIGRSAASGGDPADIAATALQWLRANGSAVVAFGFDVTLTPAQITANQNDYNPGSGHIWRLDSDANRDITGILAGVDGQRIEIVNIGAFTIRLMHQNASSSAANRILASGGANISLPPNFRAEGWYDGATQRWRLDLV